MAARPEIAAMREVVEQTVAVARRIRSEDAEKPRCTLHGACTRRPLYAIAREAAIRELEKTVAHDLTSEAVGTAACERRARARTRERTAGSAGLEAAAYAPRATARLSDPSRAGTGRLAELVYTQLAGRTCLRDARGAPLARRGGGVRRARVSAATSRRARHHQREHGPDRAATSGHERRLPTRHASPTN